jgi:hypothetical protein
LFLLTETWANPSLLNGELFPPNYQIFRKDRDVGRGGGVLLALRSNFVCTEILGVLGDILIRHKVDCVGVKVQIRNVSINILVVYIPPATPVFVYSHFF